MKNAICLILTVSAVLAGCYNEEARAVLQCEDEHARCYGVIDALCESDDRYCDSDKPFSNRSAAIVLCDGAYEACYLTATSSRTPDRLSVEIGGAP